MYRNMYYGQRCTSHLMISKKEKSRSNRKRKWKKSNQPVGSQERVIKFIDKTISLECKKLIPVWFWSNYYKALEWQNIHRLGLRESYDSAPQQDRLDAEPCKLVDSWPDSEDIQTNNKVSGESFKKDKSCNYHNDKQGEKYYTDQNCNEEFEFEMSEEMIKFFQQSFKHKLEMKKLKEEHSKTGDSEVRELHKAHGEREKEMKLLYGEGSCMIIGMETAVQLSFDKYCDVKSPKFWPNIPLNL